MCWLDLLVLSYVIKKSSKGHVLVWRGLGRLPTSLHVLGVGGSLLLEDYLAIRPQVLSLFPCRLQGDLLRAGHCDAPPPNVEVQQWLNLSLWLYCKGTQFEGKISKTSFPSKSL